MKHKLINLLAFNSKSRSPLKKPNISTSKPMRKTSISDTLIKPPKTISLKRFLPPHVDEHQPSEWQIYYGCFFPKPRHFPPSNAPFLRPVTSKKADGVWLSSESQMCLQLKRSANGVVLVVSQGGEINEEHCVSKLHFIWPQVSCVEQGPSRPSRVVFACYRDCSGQVQKFAMQFLRSSDSEAFVNCLKTEGSLNNTINIEHRCKFGSETSSPVKRIRRNRVRNSEVPELRNENPSGNSEPPEQPQLTSEGMQNTSSEEPLLFHVSGAKDTSLPLSFTDLLASDSGTSTEKDAAEVLEAPPGFNQTSQGCKSGPSFHEVLTALEMFINELGGDLALGSTPTSI